MSNQSMQPVQYGPQLTLLMGHIDSHIDSQTNLEVQTRYLKPLAQV